MRCADCSCRNGTWSNTFGQLQFAANPLQEPRTFSFNIALCAVTKFIQQSVCCASNAAHSCGWHVHLLSDEHEPPLQSPHLFGLGEVAFLHRRNMHTYIQTQVPLLRSILGYLAQHSHVSLHLQSYHCPESPESGNYLYINPPFFSVITIRCYYILWSARTVRLTTRALTHIPHVRPRQALVLLSHSVLRIKHVIKPFSSDFRKKWYEFLRLVNSHRRDPTTFGDIYLEMPICRDKGRQGTREQINFGHNVGDWLN